MKKIDSKILNCPVCRNELELNTNFVCPSCKRNYPIKDTKYYFVLNAPAIDDKLDWLKHYFKQFPKLYHLLITIISPVYIPFHLKRFLKKELDSNSKVAINLGSGNSNYSRKIINVDLFDYSNVDLVSDISNLPFKNESIDLVVSIAVLEHIQDPQLVVEEIYRVLKSEGKIYIYIPFIQGYHASPHDYQRYTINGIQQLFEDFNVLEVRCGSGPTSGFLWVFQEWLAIVLSFGIKPLYHFLHLFIMLITFPLKFLDILFIHHPYAKNIASGFTIIAGKQ